MKLKWVPKKSGSLAINIYKNPIAKRIQDMKTQGTPKHLIIEILLKEGIPYRNIKKALNAINKLHKKALDWRSPTSINETARTIRNDIRRKKISYYLGMKILIRAKNMLRTMIKKPGDNRLKQIQQEITTTKRLLMPQYGNPEAIKAHRIY